MFTLLIIAQLLLLIGTSVTEGTVQYLLETKALTWQEAEDKCQRWGGHLVTITTAEQNKYLTDEMKRRSMSNAWIGFNDQTKEGSFHWTNPLISSAYTNWRDSEPNGKTKENCAELIPSMSYKKDWKGTWNDGNCGERKQSICQKPADALLQYRFEKRKMSWVDAENECAEWGGHLATITSADQNKYIVEELKKRNLEAAWIGYNDRLNEGSFHWFDSRISSGYTNWEPSEPNGRETENCGEVIPGKLYSKEWKGMWNDGSCTGEKSSVCQKPAELQSQYKFESTLLTWLEAEYECQKWGGHLTTITSKEQNDRFANELQKRKLERAWIGYNDRIKEGSFQWVDPSASSKYTNWNPKTKEPNGKAAENCGEIIMLPGQKWHGTWNDMPCAWKQPSICEKKADVPLQYQFVKNTETWDNAEKACQQWGGHLAIITSKEQNDYLAAEMKKRKMDFSWIGYSDKSKDGTFLWVDPSTYSGYTNWHEHEPNGKNKENCVEIIEGHNWLGKWNDKSCSTKRTFICQKPAEIPPSQYNFIAKGLSWVNAELECQKWGGHLATIRSKEQSDFLADEMKKRGIPQGWIGLSDQLYENSFQWIHPLYSTGFTNWWKSEPNGKTTENCVELYTNGDAKGAWNDRACSTAMAAVCQKPADVPLQYKFESKSLSWMDAEKDCESWGGHLVTITSATQNAYLSKKLRERNLPEAWIGYNDRLQEGFFEWINPSQLQSFTNWNKNEPNGKTTENCAELIVGSAWNETWNDANCDMEQPYICQKPAGSAVTTGSVCRRDFRKIGCFLRDWSKVPHLLVTDLDPTHKNYTKDMNWDNYGEGLHSIACRCRAIAVGHYKYFAIGWYGECVSGNDQAALEEMFSVKAGDEGAEKGCINGDWGACDKDHHTECTGKGDYDFFYEVIE